MDSPGGLSYHGSSHDTSQNLPIGRLLCIALSIPASAG